MNKYDIIIIGAGPGGYVAGLYAASSGKSVLIIEKESIGGVCLNRGCIPTKALASSADALNYIKRSKEFGINASIAGIDYKKIVERKDNIVFALKKGVEGLLKKKGVKIISGAGRIADKGVVEVDGKKYTAKSVIIATGSKPAPIPGLDFDQKRILSSADILNIDRLPSKLLIIGGGVNGCEYAHIFRSFGVSVTIVEMADRLLPLMDRELGINITAAFKRTGVEVKTGTRLESVGPEFDKVVICAGRVFNSEDIGIENLKIKTYKGKIVVNNRMETSVREIYAIGDVIGGHLLAHAASCEGIAACDNIMGKDTRVDHKSIPVCVYTDPQMASVGLTENEAREKGINVKKVKVLFTAIGKSRTSGSTEGFVKLISEADSGEITGAQIVGAGAVELIAEAALFVKLRMKVSQVREVTHAHPTLSEAFAEAAFSLYGKPIHMI